MTVSFTLALKLEPLRGRRRAGSLGLAHPIHTASGGDLPRGFTSQATRDVFYGGTLFLLPIFAVLVFDTERRIPARSNAAEITPAVARGEHTWAKGMPGSCSTTWCSS